MGETAFRPPLAHVWEIPVSSCGWGKGWFGWLQQGEPGLVASCSSAHSVPAAARLRGAEKIGELPQAFLSQPSRGWCDTCPFRRKTCFFMGASDGFRGREKGNPCQVENLWVLFFFPAFWTVTKRVVNIHYWDRPCHGIARVQLALIGG